MVAGGESEIDRRRVARRVPERRRERFVRGDDRHAEVHRLLDERVAHLRQRRIAVVEAPRIARPVIEVGIVGEHLPRDDRVLGDDRGHRVQVGREGPTLGSACAWSSTRESPHNFSAIRRASSINAADCGLLSGAMGSPDKTIIDVSLLTNTSSKK
jgi:hypothetical protein